MYVCALFAPLVGELTTPHIVQQIQNTQKRNKVKEKEKKLLTNVCTKLYIAENTHTSVSSNITRTILSHTPICATFWHKHRANNRIQLSTYHNSGFNI